MKKYIKADTSDIMEEPTWVRMAIASDPDTRPRTLIRLAADPVMVVRYLVSQNPSTPFGTIVEQFPELTYFDDWAVALDLERFDYYVPSEQQQGEISDKITEELESQGFHVTDCRWDENDDSALNDEDGEYTSVYYSIYVYWKGYDNEDFDNLNKILDDIKRWLARDYHIYVEHVESF